ncbi:MAG: DUF4297 domain-containing protein [Alphaproteobacteria bacterium]|nr:DUF4297 domain-containing protein [Alphaproteobacteria bacterium]
MDSDDRGDEVLRRFRYQITYTALKALGLLRAETDMAAIYCEQIEDLLVEKKNGSFVAIQVKTRELDQAPIKSSDETVTGALAHFCRRDRMFSDRLEAFVLATNLVFFEGTGSEDIRVVLKCAREDPGMAGLGQRHSVRRYVRDFADGLGYPVGDVMATLAKVSIEERKIGIDQLDLELPFAFGEFPQFANVPLDRLMALARLLKADVLDASSLSMDRDILARHEVSSDFGALLGSLRIAGKRVGPERVQSTLASIPVVGEMEELLTIADFLERDSIPPGLTRMVMKMAAGTISPGEIDQMKDNVASLDATFLRWKERFGLAEANRRLAHFEHFALRDARGAETATRKPDSPYGPEMLTAFREKAEATWAAERAQLFGCRKEHLEGAGGLLTEECKVWWSERRTVGRGGGDDHSA